MDWEPSQNPLIHPRPNSGILEPLYECYMKGPSSGSSLDRFALRGQ
jgi:hypothetical protein